MTKIELLQIYLDRENHNLYCYEKGSVERIEYAEKIKLLEEMIAMFNNGVLDNSKNVAALPLDDGTEYVADIVLVNDFKKIYKELNIEEQFLNMRGWLLANVGKRKNKVSILRFINTWLSYERKENKKNPVKSNCSKIKPGVLNNFSQDMPDYDKITKNIVEKQSCCTR